MRKWIVDSCPNADGFSTIRIDDGSEHGNTDEEPIAVVYDVNDAETIVADHNATL